MRRYEYIDKEILTIEANNLFDDGSNKNKVLQTIDDMFDESKDTSMTNWSLNIHFLYNMNTTRNQFSFIGKISTEMRCRIISTK